MAEIYDTGTTEQSEYIELDTGIIYLYNPSIFNNNGKPCVAITVELMKNLIEQYDEEEKKIKALHPVKAANGKMEGASWSEFLKVAKPIEDMAGEGLNFIKEMKHNEKH